MQARLRLDPDRTVHYPQSNAESNRESGLFRLHVTNGLLVVQFARSEPRSLSTGLCYLEDAQSGSAGWSMARKSIVGQSVGAEPAGAGDSGLLPRQ